MSDEEAFHELTKVMEEIDYYNTYPTRQYLKESIEAAPTFKEKAQEMMRDSLVQQAVIPNWLNVRNTMGDPLEYYKKLKSQENGLS